MRGFTGSPDQHGNYEPSIGRFFGVSLLTRHRSRARVAVDEPLAQTGSGLARRSRRRAERINQEASDAAPSGRPTMMRRETARLDRPEGGEQYGGSCNSASLCRAVVRSRRRRPSPSWPRRPTPSATPRSSSPITWSSRPPTSSPYPYAASGRFTGDWTNGYLEPLAMMGVLVGADLPGDDRHQRAGRAVPQPGRDRQDAGHPRRDVGRPHHPGGRRGLDEGGVRGAPGAALRGARARSPTSTCASCGRCGRRSPWSSRARTIACPR